MMGYLNPYFDLSFWQFCLTFLQRLVLGFPEGLATDEIQIITLIAIAISSACVGSFLVLRRMTLLANGLSHTILLGIVCAYLFAKLLHPKMDAFQTLSIPFLLATALITGCVTTFLTSFLHRITKLQEDASIGFVFTSLFALGILLVSAYSRNAHVGTELVMGNVDALKKGDMYSALTILGMNLVVFIALFRGLKITTFDPLLARTLGFSPIFFNYLLMIQTSATSVGAFRAIGVIVVLAFLVVPPLIARLFTHNLNKLIVIAALVASGSAFVGVALSRHLLSFHGIGLSTAGIVVTVLGIFYALSLTFSYFFSKLASTKSAMC